MPDEKKYADLSPGRNSWVAGKRSQYAGTKFEDWLDLTHHQQDTRQPVSPLPKHLESHPIGKFYKTKTETAPFTKPLRTDSPPGKGAVMYPQGQTPPVRDPHAQGPKFYKPGENTTKVPGK